eukprot:366097-Chlamydomonas_euryale.AAC.27
MSPLITDAHSRLNANPLLESTAQVDSSMTERISSSTKRRPAVASRRTGVSRRACAGTSRAAKSRSGRSESPACSGALLYADSPGSVAIVALGRCTCAYMCGTEGVSYWKT